ncbi:MAG: modified peptide precursor CbpA [Magnetospirillum sp.]|nr:modified peptide precursor CbpA [Magnetospirillum sp.]
MEQTANTRKPKGKPAQPRPDVIAIRKTCDAEGTGLSHYVLMDKAVTR